MSLLELFQDNELSSLSNGSGSSLSQLGELHVLDIHNNCIEKLPEDIDALKTLKVSISVNNINNFLFQKNSAFVKPHLFNLEAVLCFVFSFKLNFICCQALYLQNNRIKQLPSNIGNLKNLQTLNISGNNLKDLPPSISGLTCLKTLDLSKNPKLTKLPKDIGHLHSLGRINIESSFDRETLDKKYYS